MPKGNIKKEREKLNKLQKEIEEEKKEKKKKKDRGEIIAAIGDLLRDRKPTDDDLLWIYNKIRDSLGLLRPADSKELEEIKQKSAFDLVKRCVSGYDLPGEVGRETLSMIHDTVRFLISYGT